MNALELKTEMGKLEKGLREFAFKLTKNQSDASDLYQEMAYRALKSIHQFRADSNLRAWLMTIMRNVFINIYRRKKRRPTLQDGSSNNFLIDSISHTEANQGELKLDYEELVATVECLDDMLKVPFWLAFKGYKYREIADELDVPIGTIKSRVFMARRQIQENIRRQYQINCWKELNAA
ncbi:MAG: sigma-70 family RNA polymerase sigma factor [Saprospiraceae bacterium]|nr:sigma-70 family RNA polymerase sigma factor [Saprospiraceae bacterium]